jgi:hypothetical protein
MLKCLCRLYFLVSINSQAEKLPLVKSTDSENDITITVPKEKAHPFSKTVFGVNALFNTGPVAYNNPDLAKKYSELGSQVVRFPGGTSANFYNFKTGYHDVPTIAQSQKHHEQMSNTNEYTQQTKGDIGGYRTEHFIEFQKRSKDDFSLVLNVCTQDANYTRDWLMLLKENGLEVKYVEVGNEVYFGIYKNLITSVEDYIIKAKAHVRVVREIYPQAKIGAVISSHSFTDDSFVDTVQKNTRKDSTHIWDNKIAGEDFYDAVVIHLYGSPGLPNNTPSDKMPPYPVIYKNCLSHVDFQYGKTIDYLKRTFPQKSIWVTEYHVGGFGGNLRKMRLRHSPLGVLYACNFFMNLAATPEVDLAAYHSFGHMVTMQTDPERGRVASKYHNDELDTSANYTGYQFFTEAVMGADSVVRNAIQGGLNYEGTGKYKGKFPELNSVTFLGKTDGWIFITNKLDRPYELKKLTIGKNTTSHIQEITVMQPGTDLREEKVLIEKRKLEFPVKLPAYSITRIKIKTQ